MGIALCFVPLILAIVLFTFAYKIKITHQLIAVLLGLLAVLPISFIQYFIPDFSGLFSSPVLFSFLAPVFACPGRIRCGGKEAMRIDKFLKNSRIIKRRTVAKDACEQGRIMVNGKPAKPGTDVSTGDEIEVLFGNGSLKARVIAVPETV